MAMNILKVGEDPAYFPDDPRWIPGGPIIVTHPPLLFSGLTSIVTMREDATSWLVQERLEDFDEVACVEAVRRAGQHAWGVDVNAGMQRKLHIPGMPVPAIPCLKG